MAKQNQIEKALAALIAKRDAIDAAILELKIVREAKPARTKKVTSLTEAARASSGGA